MGWNMLSKESQDYVDRYIRTKGITREQALQESVVQAVIHEYETGTKERTVWL